jgi:hypothetical protein
MEEVSSTTFVLLLIAGAVIGSGELGRRLFKRTPDAHSVATWTARALLVGSAIMLVTRLYEMGDALDRFTIASNPPTRGAVLAEYGGFAIFDSGALLGLAALVYYLGRRVGATYLAATREEGER